MSINNIEYAEYGYVKIEHGFFFTLGEVGYKMYRLKEKTFFGYKYKKWVQTSWTYQTSHCKTELRQKIIEYLYWKEESDKMIKKKGPFLSHDKDYLFLKIQKFDY